MTLVVQRDCVRRCNSARVAREMEMEMEMETLSSRLKTLYKEVTARLLACRERSDAAVFVE